MQNGIPPWQMWGSTQTVDVRGNGSVSKVPQMTSLNFDRPDTFSFFFFAQILQINGAPPPNAFRVAIRVNFGLGRDTTTFENFCILEWANADLFDLTPRICSSTQLRENYVGRSSPNIVEWIPAQTINVDADAFYEGNINNASITKVLVGSYIAPRSHVRADWFAKNAAPGPVPVVPLPHRNTHHLYER